MLQTPNPFGTLKDIFEQRQDIYALADATVEAHKELSIEEMSDLVIDVLLERPDVLEQTNE